MQEAPKRLGAERAVEGTNQFNSQVTDALRKRTPRLPLASDTHVESSNATGNSSRVSKGRGTGRSPGFGPATLGPATGAGGSSSNAGGDATGGATNGRSVRRGLSADLNATGAIGSLSGGGESNSTSTRLPFSSGGTRVKTQLPPAARKGLTDSATRLKGVDLGGMSQGNSAGSKRMRGGADSAIRKGPAGGLGSGTQSGSGSGSPQGISRGSSRMHNGGKGKGRGGE